MNNSVYCAGDGAKAVTRMKKSPPNVVSIIAAGSSWTDSTFTGNEEILYANDKTRYASLASTMDTDL